MRYRIVVSEDKRGETWVVPARIPWRWLPDVRGRWKNWRRGRKNLRSAAEQGAAAQAIAEWLAAVVRPDGIVESVRSDPRENSVFITVIHRQSRRKLEFFSATAWPEVGPRDQLAHDVLEFLAGDEAEVEFPLAGYAEQCEMDRRWGSADVG